jgi:hypothetical protein
MRMTSTGGSAGQNPHPLGRAVNYDESKVFSRLQRRIDATQRNYQRALKQLQQLQQDAEEALLPDNPDLGFAPSQVGQALLPDNPDLGLAPSQVGQALPPGNPDLGFAPSQVGQALSPGNPDLGFAPSILDPAPAARLG